MLIGRNITGGHGTSPSCLSQSHDRTIMPNTIRTWVVLQESDGYNMVRNEHSGALEPVITVPRGVCG
jgi:hypothetical protein